jgi:hypothetical protein
MPAAHLEAGIVQNCYKQLTGTSLADVARQPTFIELSNGSLLREPFSRLSENVTQTLTLAIDDSYEIPVRIVLWTFSPGLWGDEDALHPQFHISKYFT